MKKLLFSFALAILATVIFAQTTKTLTEKPSGYVAPLALQPLTTALDFTVTFTDGTTASLFNTCNAGNSVLLDFFFTSCVYCQTYAPIIDQAYVAHSSGAGNIKFWGIDTGDNNAAVIAYKSTYGDSNPCASGVEGGGSAVCNTYSTSFTWSGYPTYSVVCPDHTYSHDVNYPPTATGFNSYFATCGTSAVTESSDPVQTKITLMYPLPAKDNLNAHVYVDKSSQIKIELCDILGNVVYTSNTSEDKGYYNASIDVTTFDSGIYFIKLTQDNVVKDVQRVMVMH